MELALRARHGRDFQWEQSDDTHFNVWLDIKVASGALTRGKWRKRAFHGTETASLIIRRNLDADMRDGTVSWDRAVSRILILTMLTAFGSRAGDIDLSKGYTHQFFRFEDVTIYIEDNKLALLSSLAMRTELKYTKNFKSNARPNEEFTHFLRASTAPHLRHMCPILWLLAHALRHDLVESDGLHTIRGVLQVANRRIDRTVIWKQPRAPVLCASVASSGKLLVDTPARADHILKIVKLLGQTAGVFGRIYAHAFRAGAARDLRYSSSGHGAETGIREVGQFLSHSAKATTSGITEGYIGGSERDTYTQRLHNPAPPVIRRSTIAADPVSYKKALNARSSASENEQATASIPKLKCRSWKDPSKAEKESVRRHILKARKLDIEASGIDDMPRGKLGIDQDESPSAPYLNPYASATRPAPATYTDLSATYTMEALSIDSYNNFLVSGSIMPA